MTSANANASDLPSTPTHDNANNNNNNTDTDNDLPADKLKSIASELLLEENLLTFKWNSQKDTDPFGLEAKSAVVSNESRSKKQEAFAEITGNQNLPESPSKTDDTGCCPTLKSLGVSTKLEHLHEGLLRDLHTLNIDKKKKMNEEKRKDVLSCEAVTGGTTHCFVQIPKAKDHQQLVGQNRKKNWMRNLLFALGGCCTDEQDEDETLLDLLCFLTKSNRKKAVGLDGFVLSEIDHVDTRALQSMCDMNQNQMKMMRSCLRILVGSSLFATEHKVKQILVTR